MERKRNYQLNNIRAFATILVVFGHSIIIYSSGWGVYSSMVEAPIFDWIKRFINIIQMPIFFSLSGFLFESQVDRKRIGEILKTKLLRLFIPYYIISLFWMVPIKLLIAYPAYQGRSIGNIVVQDILLFGDNGHLWYLPCLFLCFLVHKIVKILYRENNIVELIIWSVALLVSIVADRLIVVIVPLCYQVCKFYVWFMTGGLIYRFGNAVNRTTDRILPVVGVIFTVLSAVFGNSIVTVIATIGDLYIIYRIMPKNKSRFCCFVSDKSFGIYLLHSPLIYITFFLFSNSSPAKVILINFVLFGMVATLLTSFITRSRLAFVLGAKAPMRKSE